MILGEKQLSKKLNRSNKPEILFQFGMHEVTKSSANLTRRVSNSLFQWVCNCNCCTGKMSQIAQRFEQNGKAVKTRPKMFGCLRGTLVVTKVLGGLFGLIRKC